MGTSGLQSVGVQDNPEAYEINIVKPLFILKIIKPHQHFIYIYIYVLTD